MRTLTPLHGSISDGSGKLIFGENMQDTGSCLLSFWSSFLSDFGAWTTLLVIDDLQLYCAYSTCVWLTTTALTSFLPGQPFHTTRLTSRHIPFQGRNYRIIWVIICCEWWQTSSLLGQSLTNHMSSHHMLWIFPFGTVTNKSYESHHMLWTISISLNWMLPWVDHHHRRPAQM